MPKTPANLRKMTAAVSRWIDEANGRVDGAEALVKRAAWMDGQIAALGRDGATPENLIGLTVWDLIRARGELEAAAKAHFRPVQKAA